MDRVAFCNTGSEAVLAALRIARTVTGNDLVVMFEGAYHGLFDEVIVRGSKRNVSFPAAPGIPRSAVENTLILDYDDPASLDVIRERADELAAILVEPVQSRAPHIQPKAFLQELRKISEACGAALIFDEVITGFRIAPGGAQEHFGVRADIATYGKIPGGGMPIGMVTGCRRFMDALDGGGWQYGDDTFPEVGVTYFAGTFVRHPLTLAAMRATLGYLREQGPALQARTNAMGDRLASAINDELARRNCQGLKIKNFGSLFKPKLDEGNPFAPLFYHWMRRNGVHIWDARPCFVTVAHTEEDVDALISAFIRTVDEMQRAGFLDGQPGDSRSTTKPHPDARLGRTQDGRPAWFVPDPNRPGNYLRLDE